jgi:hypothetical protein
LKPIKLLLKVHACNSKVEKVSFATKNSMRFHEWSIDSYKTSCFQVLMKVAWCWRLRNYHHPYKQLLCGHAPCTVDLCRGTSSMHYSFLSISSVFVCVWITILHFSARKRSLYMDFGSGNCLINNPQASNYETLKRLLFNFRGLTEGFKCFRKPQSSPKLVYLFLIESQTCKVYQLCPKSFKKFLTWLYC